MTQLKVINPSQLTGIIIIFYFVFYKKTKNFYSKIKILFEDYKHIFNFSGKKYS
jgi:hypothetical protein